MCKDLCKEMCKEMCKDVLLDVLLDVQGNSEEGAGVHPSSAQGAEPAGRAGKEAEAVPHGTCSH